MTRSDDYQQQTPHRPESREVHIPFSVSFVPKPYQPFKSEQKLHKSAVGQSEDPTFQMLLMSSFLMPKTRETCTERQESEY